MIKKFVILLLAFLFININGASDAKKKNITIPEEIIRYIKSINDMQQDIGSNIELVGASAELLSDRAFNNIVSILLRIQVNSANKLTDEEIVVIWGLIKSNRYNLKDLIDMILKIEYLDIPVLRRPMLLTALEVFVTMFENNKNRAAIEQLKRLPKNIRNELKYLYFDQYPMLVFHHYAHVEKDLELLIRNCRAVFFTPNRELLVAWNKDKIMVVDPIADNIIVQIPSMNNDFKNVMVNNNYIVGINITNNLFIWDIKTGYLIKHMPGIVADLKYIDDKCFCFTDSILGQLQTITHFYKFDDLTQEWLGLHLLRFDRLIFIIDESLGNELLLTINNDGWGEVYDIQGIPQVIPHFENISRFDNSYDNSVVNICPKLYPKDFILRYVMFKKNSRLFRIYDICSNEECNMRVKDKHVHFGINNNFLLYFDQLPIIMDKLVIRYCRNEFYVELRQEYLFRVLRNIYNQDLIDLMQKIYPEQPSSCSVM